MKKDSSQLPLFERPKASLAVPDVIHNALLSGATLALSLSAGKDSHAMVNEVVPWFRSQGYPGKLFIVHADLGRAEWPQTPEMVERIAKQVEVPLVVVQRKKGDLIQRIEERIESLHGSGKPFWPSSSSRYCTSYLKIVPIDRVLRNPSPFWPSSANRYCTSDLKRGPIDSLLRESEVIISAEGVRGDESSARSKKPIVEIRPSITASSINPNKDLSKMSPEEAMARRNPGQRLAFNWRPIFHWNEEEVWRACGTSILDLAKRKVLYKSGFTEEALADWPCHPAYVFGNQRLSCAFCVLGSKADLLNGAQHNPGLYGHLIQLEIIGKSTFKHGWSLTELPVTGEAARVRDEILKDKEEAA